MKPISELRTALLATAGLAVLVCGLYPLTVFVVGQAFFPVKSNGSLMVERGAAIGSELIGQPFSEPRYFHPRPSAAGNDYDATCSAGSNLGPTSRSLVETVEARLRQYRAENGLTEGTQVPADAVTASGSGLDPHIGIENARLQTPRVAKARGLSEQDLRKRVADATEGRTFGLFGEPRVNVLLLNRSLDVNP